MNTEVAASPLRKGWKELYRQSTQQHALYTLSVARLCLPQEQKQRIEQMRLEQETDSISNSEVLP